LLRNLGIRDDRREEPMDRFEPRGKTERAQKLEGVGHTFGRVADCALGLVNPARHFVLPKGHMTDTILRGVGHLIDGIIASLSCYA